MKGEHLQQFATFAQVASDLERRTQLQNCLYNQSDVYVERTVTCPHLARRSCDPGVLVVTRLLCGMPHHVQLVTSGMHRLQFVCYVPLQHSASSGNMYPCICESVRASTDHTLLMRAPTGMQPNPHQPLRFQRACFMFENVRSTSHHALNGCWSRSSSCSLPCCVHSSVPNRLQLT